MYIEGVELCSTIKILDTVLSLISTCYQPCNKLRKRRNCPECNTSQNILETKRKQTLKNCSCPLSYFYQEHCKTRLFREIEAINGIVYHPSLRSIEWHCLLGHPFLNFNDTYFALSILKPKGSLIFENS